MKTEDTLRFLLLRHMKRLEGMVPREVFLQAMRSLTVQPAQDSYLVTWEVGGARHERRFARDAFAFYVRGDAHPERRSVDDDLRTDDNDFLAAGFAAEVFGTAAPTRSDADETPDPRRWQAVAEGLAFAAAITIGGAPPAAAGALLCALLAEHLQRGRLYASVLFVPLAVVGPTWAAAAGALAYAALQFLDPNRALRAVRVGLCLLAGAYAVTRGLLSAGPLVDAALAVLSLVALATAAMRSLYAMHFRSLPLALPFFAAGLYADALPSAALAALVVTIVFAVVVAQVHRYVPIQRERTLTPNG